MELQALSHSTTVSAFALRCPPAPNFPDMELYVSTQPNKVKEVCFESVHYSLAF